MLTFAVKWRKLDENQNWSKRFRHLISHAMDIRRDMTVTRRKIKVLKTKMDKLLGESLTHLDEEFERFRRGIIKVKDYLFTFLSDFSVPFDNNASYPNFSFIPTFGGSYHKRLVL